MANFHNIDQQNLVQTIIVTLYIGVEAPIVVIVPVLFLYVLVGFSFLTSFGQSEVVRLSGKQRGVAS